MKANNEIENTKNELKTITKEEVKAAIGAVTDEEVELIIENIVQLSFLLAESCNNTVKYSV